MMEDLIEDREIESEEGEVKSLWDNRKRFCKLIHTLNRYFSYHFMGFQLNPSRNNAQKSLMVLNMLYDYLLNFMEENKPEEIRKGLEEIKKEIKKIEMLKFPRVRGTEFRYEKEFDTLFQKYRMVFQKLLKVQDKIGLRLPVEKKGIRSIRDEI